MDKSLLKELCDNLNVRGGSLPALHIPEMFELLEELFTEEEAKVACEMPPTATSLQDLSEGLSRPTEDIYPLLESMADKGVVATRKKHGVVLYKLLPVVPGFFEFQFMRGGDTDRDRHLARLLRTYADAAKAEVTKVMPIPEDMTPFMRVIPVEKTIKAGQQVYTFEQLSTYIESADAISVGHCYCHHEAYLLGKETCDAPEYRCMSFGPGALFTSERGIARLITKEEALDIIAECEEKGLVHMGSNTSKFLEFLCNCCSCHCGTLKNLNKMGKPIFSATSGYLAHVDKEKCEECGTCVEMCPMKAVSKNEEETATVDALRCIGCGICASHCPADAISMNPRPDVSRPPETPRDLRKVVMADFERTMAEQK
jgi:ferredoxin